MLHVSGLTYRSYSRTIIERISFEVPPGAKLALFGSSGAGKTTVLKILAQTLTPTEGVATLEGVSLFANRGAPNGVMVWQNHVLFEHLTVGENVAFGLAARKDSEANIREKVDSVLTR